MSNTRAQDFRYLYASGYAISMNNREITIKFGVNEDQDEFMFEQVGIVMNHSSAKLLGLILNQSIASLEKMSGQEIPINPSGEQKIEEMARALANAFSAAQPAGPSQGA